MIKIRIKLKTEEAQLLAQHVLMAGRRMKVAGMDSLLASTTLENLFIRMYQQIPQSLDKHVLKLNLTEVAVLQRFVLPQMQDSDGTLEFFVANSLIEYMNRRIDHEVALYNSMKNQ